MAKEAEKIVELDTQIKIFKYVGGPLLAVAWTLIFALGAWVYATGIEVSDLKKEVSFQVREGDKRDKRINLNSDKTNAASGDMKEVKNELKNINSKIDQGFKDMRNLMQQRR